MKKIDNKEVYYKPDISLLYGTITVPDYYDYRYNKKIDFKFQEKQLSTDGIKHGVSKKDLIEIMNKEIKIYNLKTEAEKFYEELLSKKQIVSKATKRKPGKVKIELTNEMLGNWRKLCDSDIDAIYTLCNLLSLYENLEPAFYNRGINKNFPDTPAEVSIETTDSGANFVLDSSYDSYFAESKTGWHVEFSTYDNKIYLIRIGQ